jgi:hypothetical protein
MTAEQRFNAWQKRYGEIDPHRIRYVYVRDDDVLVIVGKSGYRYPVSEDDAALACAGRRVIVSKEYELRSQPIRAAERGSTI